VRVVFDNNVVAGGVGWDGESYLCLAQLAHRRAIAYASEITLNEARETCARLIQELNFSHNAAARLNWYLSVVRLVEPAPLGKQRSRDAKDDPYLAAALAARANFIVSYDKDLLELKKPFGVEIIRPAQFLKLVKG
jgi:putative PIN family toxin of toxin-antitoxin system